MKKAVALVALTLVAGCSWAGDMYDKTFGDSEVVYHCPQIGLVPEADRMPVTAKTGAAFTDADVTVLAGIGTYSGACRPDSKKGVVEFDIDVEFKADRGPAGAGVTVQELPYFLAILGPDEAILQRESFTTSLSFPEGAPSAQAKSEQHHISLPLGNLDQAHAYKVVIGFALTPEQLEYVNARKTAVEKAVAEPAAEPAPAP